MLIFDRIKNFISDLFHTKHVKEENKFLNSYDFIQMAIEGTLNKKEIKQLRLHLYTKINDKYSFIDSVFEEFPHNLPTDILKVMISEAFRFNAKGAFFIDNKSFQILNNYIQKNPDLIYQSFIQALQDLPLDFKSSHLNYYEKFCESFFNAIEHFQLIPHLTTEQITDLKILNENIKNGIKTPNQSSKNGLNLIHPYYHSYRSFCHKIELLNTKVQNFKMKQDFKDNLVQELDKKETIKVKSHKV